MEIVVGSLSSATPDQVHHNSSSKKTKSEKVIPPEPIEGQCAFYVLRKSRFCRFRPHLGHKYCVEHALACGAKLERTRVQCPYNPKHTCYEDCLKKHMKKCLRMMKNTNVYYEEGINSGDLDETDIEQVEPNKLSVRTAPSEDILRLIEKVEHLHRDHIGTIYLEELDHASLEEELSAPYYGFKVVRQRKQQASLIGHLERLNLLRDGSCFIELGAGRGQFAHWVQKAMKTCDSSSFILVDKDTCRYKFDSFHKGVNQGPSFERLRINLADINLGKVESIRTGNRPVVGMGKHLCGGATDLALRCLMETLNSTVEHGNDVSNTGDCGIDLAGIAVATCCHHRCNWQSYVGKSFIREDCAMNVREFSLLCNMTSWATCTWQGWKKHVPKKTETTDKGGIEQNGQTQEVKVTEDGETEFDPDEVTDFDHSPLDGEERRDELCLTPEEREEVGRKCKQILDFGRVKYLRDKGMRVCLKAYIDPTYTPENIVLLATPP